MRPNKITAHNAGWPSQFRFAVDVFWSGVCEFFRYMRATAVVCALALMLMTACSMRHRLVPSAGQNNAPLGSSPAGDFVFGDASRPAVALRINPDGTYSAEHASPIEFWPMIEGNKVYPQRIKPSVEKGHWTWNRTTGALTLVPETTPSPWWPIDLLQFDPTHPDHLATGEGVVLARAER